MCELRQQTVNAFIAREALVSALFFSHALEKATWKGVFHARNEVLYL